MRWNCLKVFALPAQIVGYGLFLVTIIACHRPNTRQEAGQIVGRIDVLIQAHHQNKAEPWSQLKATTCTTPAICEVKAKCVQGFEPMVQAIQEIQRIKQEHKQNPNVGAEEQLQRLEQAETKMKNAKPGMNACADAAGQLRVKYQL
jgi:predicted FMN-binding regulatory protein PaiB